MQQRTSFKELAHREGHGVAVTLRWRPDDNRLTVGVSDTRTGELFELGAHPEDALEVFYHPYAYAAYHGLDYGVETAASCASAEALAA